MSSYALRFINYWKRGNVPRNITLISQGCTSKKEAKRVSKYRTNRGGNWVIKTILSKEGKSGEEKNI